MKDLWRLASRSADLSQLGVRPRASTGVRHVTPIKSQLLYQLSYAGAPVIVFAESSTTCRHDSGRPPALLSNCCQTTKLSSNLTASERGKLRVFPDLVSDARNLRPRASGRVSALVLIAFSAWWLQREGALRHASCSAPSLLSEAQLGTHAGSYPGSMGSRSRRETGPLDVDRG